jgi:predicted  nucleic acid-binding Zn-ribbon protein
MSAAIASLITGALATIGTVAVGWLAHRQKQLERDSQNERDRRSDQENERRQLMADIRDLRAEMNDVWDEVRKCHEERDRDRRRWETDRRQLSRRLAMIEGEVAKWKRDGLVPFEIVDALEKRLDDASRRQDDSDSRDAARHNDPPNPPWRT